jgi:hypothetical protein
VDAIAVVEPPGAVYSTQFEQHDQAMQQLQELVAFNSELSSAIVDADVVLEQTMWDSYTLPVSGVGMVVSAAESAAVAAADFLPRGCSQWGAEVEMSIKCMGAEWVLFMQSLPAFNKLESRHAGLGCFCSTLCRLLQDSQRTY